MRVDDTATRRGAGGGRGAGRARSVRVSRHSLVARQLTWRGRLGDGGARRKRRLTQLDSSLSSCFRVAASPSLKSLSSLFHTLCSSPELRPRHVLMRSNYGSLFALRHLHRVTRCSSTDLTILANQQRILLLQELHTPLLVQEPVGSNRRVSTGEGWPEKRGGQGRGAHRVYTRRTSGTSTWVAFRRRATRLDSVISWITYPVAPNSSCQLPVCTMFPSSSYTHGARFPIRSWSGSRAQPETAKRPLLGPY